MLNRRPIICAPFFLMSLALLLLNDHYLKAEYPGFITGKLSDFAGLFMLSLFIYYLFRNRIDSIRGISILNVSIAALFIIWKIAPVENVTQWIFSNTGLPVPTRVKDPTDLIALVVLLAAFNIERSYIKVPVRFYSPFSYKRMASVAISGIVWFAIVATSPAPSNVYYYLGAESISAPKDTGVEEFLFKVEEVLAEGGFKVNETESYSGKTFIMYIISTDSLGMEARGEVRLFVDNNDSSFVVEGVQISTTQLFYHDHSTTYKKFLADKILNPLRKEFGDED